MSQQGFTQHPGASTVSRLGGLEIGPTDHMVTETLIRGMHAYWHRVMA